MDKANLTDDKKIVLNDFYNVGALAGQALDGYEKLTGPTLTKIIIFISIVNAGLVAWLVMILL